MNPGWPRYVTGYLIQLGNCTKAAIELAHRSRLLGLQAFEYDTIRVTLVLSR